MGKKIVNRNVRGVKMSLLANNRTLELCSKMNYQKENLDFIDSIPKGGTLFDLGACEGRFSIYAALKGINVIAFEPEKMNFKALSENKKLVLSHLMSMMKKAELCQNF